jgi:hypothetical protein
VSEVSVGDFLKALVMKAVLDRTAGRRPAGAAAAPTPAPAAALARAPGHRPETAARPRRAAPALICFAVGAIAMLLFESTLTRVIGVVALFGFVIAGVFAIADPRWLASAPELGDPDASPRQRRG